VIGFQSKVKPPCATGHLHRQRRVVSVTGKRSMAATASRGAPARCRSVQCHPCPALKDRNEQIHARARIKRDYRSDAAFGLDDIISAIGQFARKYADAICEAVSRPGMRFVPIKSAEQQATLMLHKTRELLVKQRTMSINALRGHLSEFGIIAAKGIGRVDELLDLAESDATLPSAANAGVKVLAQALEGLNKAIDVEGEITNANGQSEMVRLLDKVPGIGKLIASAIAASVPDPSVFKSGRDFAAWLGLTPRQNSSGGKQSLGGITKQGNRYIRKMLVLGETSLLNVLGKRKGVLRDWIVGLLAKKPARLVTVALANKLARILWAMMKTGESFRAEMFAKA
jgi:transposase